MSKLDDGNSSLPVPPLRTWDFMETAFVSLIAYATHTLTAWIVIVIILSMPDGPKTWSPDQFGTRGAANIVASPLTIAVLWIAIQMARRDFAEYLALNWPSPGELMRALAIMAILLLAEALAGYAVGAKGVSPYLYVNAEQAGGLLIFLIGACVAAPVMEEFVFRGFMFRGWSQSFLGPVGCIVLTSVVWGMIHTQYDWLGRLYLVAAGLALGYFRWRSNSTWLTVMVHSAMNIFVFLAAAL